MKWVALILFLELLSMLIMSSFVGVLSTLGLLILCMSFGLLLIVMSKVKALSLLHRARSRNFAITDIGFPVYAIAGVLFFLPGFFLDGLGILLIITPNKVLYNVASYFFPQLKRKTEQQSHIIDVEFERKE